MESEIRNITQLMPRLILIGCGPHAKRIYLPALEKIRKTSNIQLKLIVDLESTKKTVEDIINGTSFKPDKLFIDAFSGEIPNYLDDLLSRYVKENDINGVIIATEPLVHKAYATWALKNSLNILIDKPITARANSTSDLISANGILDDYLLIFDEYKSAQRKKETVFVINSQRRFHAGFNFVEKLIKEIADITNCPVTNISSYHSDGQWRLPSEIVTQDYHPYCFGYGKASHSGYHIFDILYRLYTSSGLTNKLANTMEIVSSFLQPNGFIKQFTEKDYYNIFGSKYHDVKIWKDAELFDIYKNYGEIDVSAIITLKKDQDVIGNFTANLIHNGFARRTWITPGVDLYKGNGRVKHEHHNIQQGPFQNIQIHSYQANDRHDNMTSFDDSLGGNNHFDICVFRNPIVTGNDNSLKTYKFSEVISNADNENMIFMESAKFSIVKNFIDYISGFLNKKDLPSQIEDHIVPVQIMSGIYRSHILRNKDMDCIVRLPFGRQGMDK